MKLRFTLRTVANHLLLFAVLFIPALKANAAESPLALEAWDQAVHEARAKLAVEASRLDEGYSAKQWKFVGSESHNNVAPQVRGEAKPVPSALIHHWTGAIMICDTEVSELLSVLQDYPKYVELFAPAVVDAKVIRSQTNDYTYRLKFIQKGFGIKVGLSGNFRTTYHRIDSSSGYSITEGTHFDELQDPGTPDEQ